MMCQLRFLVSFQSKVSPSPADQWQPSWQTSRVCVEVLKKGAVHEVRTPGFFRHFLRGFLQIGKCSHLTSRQLYRSEYIYHPLKTSDMTLFPIYSKLQLSSFWTIKIFPWSRCNCLHALQTKGTLWRQREQNRQKTHRLQEKQVKPEEAWTDSGIGHTCTRARPWFGQQVCGWSGGLTTLSIPPRYMLGLAGYFYCQFPAAYMC